MGWRKIVRNITRFLSKKIVENKSIIASKTIEPNASDKIKQTASKIDDERERNQQNLKKIIKAGTEKYFLAFIDNIQAESRQMTTLLGKVSLVIG